jgi:DNA-binding NarL/FixJ family response regulator
MSDIRVLIAEDQTLMREGLCTILELEDGFSVVGVARDGAEAIALAQQTYPDIVLMDVQMPCLNGVLATARLTAALPKTRVIILTTFDYDEYVFEGVKAGARGYLLKDMPACDLLAAIRRVHAGESIVQPGVANRLIEEFSRQRGRTSSHEGEGLSDREREVLRLISDGLSNREISNSLALAEGTVKNYVSSILDKLHAANRTQAARLAREQNLIY